MALKVLSENDVQQFINEGHVLLPEAFPREVAAAIRAALWEKIGLGPDDPDGWTKPMIHVQEAYGYPPFTDAFTSRVDAAYDDLLGEGRWTPKSKKLGWFPIAFPGFDTGPWQPPGGDGAWHIDGNFFHHHLTSPEQGLLPIFLLSDIEPGDGGTAIIPGAHFEAARVLAAAEPEGLAVGPLSYHAHQFSRERVMETTGRAGDVVLMHPFMSHCRSMNTGTRVRFICNPCVSLREPINLNRIENDYSPLEQSIKMALEAAPV